MSSRRKLSDKEFDRYARNILKKPEGIAFDESAWAAIEGQVEQAPATSSPYKWIIPTIVAIVILVGYFAYQGWSTSESTTAAAVVEGTQIAAKEDVSVDPIESITQPTKEATSKPGTAMSATTVEEPIQVASQSVTDAGSGVNVTQGNAVGSLEESSNPSSLTRNDQQISAASEQAFSADEEFQAIDFALLSASRPGVIYAETPHYEIIIIQAQPAEPISVSEEETVIPKSYSKWNLGLTIAPDFSTVSRLQEFTQPGFDMGVTVEYFFNRRLSITSGAIVTRKIYNTSNLSEYTFPDDFWEGGEEPDEILANCKVIDIPINLRYRLIEGIKTSLYASAGLSSYLMLNERYDYNYNDRYTGSQVPGWEVSNENNHFFGVYNLSLGISHRFSPRFSFEAEPFIKNSLGGVGWGQVRLKSTGALFSLKYHFLKN